MFPSYKFCDGQLTDYSEMEKEYRKNENNYYALLKWYAKDVKVKCGMNILRIMTLLSYRNNINQLAGLINLLFNVYDKSSISSKRWNTIIS